MTNRTLDADKNEGSSAPTKQGARLALVTGAASGIGMATALRLIDDGFHVVGVDIKHEPGKVLDELAALGTFTFRPLDLLKEDDVRQFIANLDPIDALVNCAGIIHEGSFFDVKPADFMRVYEINVIATFVVSQAAASKMQRGAKIVNVASFAYLGTRNAIQYSTSKGAVVTMTRSMAAELLAAGIDVNAVAPGVIDTPMLQQLSEERRSAYLASQPRGRAGTSEDVAQAVSFLCSPRTRFITGQVLLIDDGKSIGRVIS